MRRDWALHRVGARTWMWTARCGHSGVGGARARTAGLALAHVRACERLSELAQQRR